VLVVYLGDFINARLDTLSLSDSVAAKLQDNLAAAVYGLLLIVVIRTMPGGLQAQLRRLPGLVLRRTTRSPGTSIGTSTGTSTGTPTGGS
jgi:branched-chain amino acid transport system permease protein